MRNAIAEARQAVEPSPRLAEPQSGSRQLLFRPFSFLRTLPREPAWLWRGFLAPGSLTMLAGHPFAGKSMLVGGLLKAMEVGESFVGRATLASTAAVLTEEDANVLRARAEMFDLFQLQSTYVDRSSGVLGLEWPEMVARATKHALRARHRLLVIDTFPGLAGLHGEEENDAGAITERLGPLQAAAGEGLAVLFLHHMNGQGQPRGSKAFRGSVDISIRFIRVGKTGVFRLESESRFPTATPARLTGRLIQAPRGWLYVESEKAEATPSDPIATTDRRLREALREAGPDGLSYAEIDATSGLSRDQAKKRFPDWRDEGKLGRRGAGTKSDPFRWFLPPP